MGIKLLAYLLALLNVGYLLWQFHLGRINPAPPQSGHQSSIMLVGEYLRAQRGTDILQALESQSLTWQQTDLDWMLESMRRANNLSLQPGIRLAAGKNTPIRAEHLVSQAWQNQRVCRQTGPFADQALLRQWLDKTSGKHAQIFHQNIVVEKDYQVYYPAAKSLAQSQQDKAILLAQGYQDVWKISDGDLKGGYSLGVFSDKQRAMNLKNQLVANSVKAEIYIRKEINTQWFARLWLEQREAEAIEALTACVAH